MLTLLVGLFLMLASCCRLGFFADFVSYPVQVGFKAGIGCVIVIDQLPKLLGIHIHKEGFFRDVASIVASLPAASLLTVAVGAGTVVLLVLIGKIRPQWPAPLIVIGSSHRGHGALGVAEPWSLRGGRGAGGTAVLPAAGAVDWRRRCGPARSASRS